MRAHVLTAVGGHGGAQGVKGAAENLRELVSGGHGVDAGGAQSIDGALQGYGANGRDEILQRHGNAVGQKLGGVIPAEPQLSRLKPEHGKLFPHVPQAQQPGDSLGQIGGPGSAGHAEAQHGDEQQIQRHVERCGQCQKQQRTAAVTHGADHGGGGVIEHHKGNAPEDPVDVVKGVWIGFRRGMHGGENPPAEDQNHGHDRDGEKGAQIDCAGHIAAQLGQIPGAEGIGCRDAEAHTQADAGAENHKIQGTGGADAAQGVHSHEFSHNHGVHQIINLLQQQAKKDGDGKLQNHAGRIAPG